MAKTQKKTYRVHYRYCSASVVEMHKKGVAAGLDWAKPKAKLGNIQTMEVQAANKKGAKAAFRTWFRQMGATSDYRKITKVVLAKGKKPAW